MDKKYKRGLIGAGALIGTGAAAAAASYTLSKYMIALAMNREQPKSLHSEGNERQNLRGTPYLESFLKDVGAAGENLKNQEFEDVQITSHDGIQLVGHLHTCPNPKRLIVAMHGWRSTWYEDFGLISDFWNRQDCAVLYAEQRGQNNSGGDFMGFGMLERYDCLDWTHWLNQRFPEQLPIYLAGVSMGATTVLMAANLDLPENVKGIAADCGFTSASAIWKHVAQNNLHIAYGLHSAAAEDLCRKKIQIGPNDCTVPDVLSHSNIPVLFVHGTDDTFVPIEMTYENYKACAGPKRLLVVPGADHGMSYYLEKEKYEEAVIEFWKFCEKEHIAADDTATD